MYLIANRCHNLQELTIIGGMATGSMLRGFPKHPSLKSLILGGQCEVSRDGVCQILNRCGNLERAEFHRIKLGRAKFGSRLMPKLKSLLLHSSVWHMGGRFLDIGDLLQRIPNIQSLILSGLVMPLQITPDFSPLGKLEVLTVSCPRGRQPLLLPSSLQKLDLSLHQGPDPHVHEDHLKSLVHLSIANASRVSARGVKDILHANMGNLTHLNAGRCFCMKDGLLGNLLETDCFKTVTDLNLDECDVTDDDAIRLAVSAPALKNLSLASTRVTGAGLRPLVTNSEGSLPCTLKTLCLDGCDACGVDFVEMARARGVKVSFKFDSDRLGGRRVRH